MKSFFRRFTGIMACVLLTSLCAEAQNYEPDSLIVHAGAIYHNNDVYVRWVPFNYETWQWGLDHGYRLERQTLKSNGTELSMGDIIASKVVLDPMLMPIPEMDWEPMADTNDMAGVAAGMIYGDSLEVFNSNNAGFSDVINQNQERKSRFGFSLFAADNTFSVAEAMGIGYLDKSVDPDKEYLYTVEINNIPTNTISRRGAISIETNGNGALPIPANLQAIPRDSTVVLRWDSEELGRNYSSYCVEYSDDEGNTFKPAHDLPLIFGEKPGTSPTHAAFRDSLPSNGDLYVYRLRGKSAFGIMGPYSDTIHVVGRPDPLGENPAILNVDELDEGILTINWIFPKELEDKINGFDIYRSDKANGEYTKINSGLLSTGKRVFEDDDPMAVNYYRVTATDENGYLLSSIAVLGQPNDEEAPIPPEGLSCSVNSKGLVTLTWTPNTEVDLMGYRVYMSTTSAGDFAQITNSWITDSTFQYYINLNTLSEYAYFAVKALDQRENTSDLSSYCTVERPDIIPPSAPNITNVVAAVGEVQFEWELSSSSDVVTYKFQRKPHGAPGWKDLLIFDAAANPPLTYTDDEASPSRYWDYRLTAIDDAGLVAHSKVVKAKPTDNGIRSEIKGFYGFLTNYLNPDPSQFVSLGWFYEKTPDLIGFEIYRAFGNNEKRSYEFLTIEEAESLQAQMPGVDFGFADFDTEFDDIPVQSTYTTNNLSFQTQITGGTVTYNGNTATITPNQTNVPANPQNGVTIRYWVIAKFIDGATSPLSNEVMVQY